MRFPTTIWLYTTVFAIKFTLFTWSMSQDLSFLWWKNNMIHCWLRRSFNLSNCQDIPSIYWYMYWFFSLNLQIHYLMYTVLYAWLFFLLNSQLHVDSIFHLSWLFQVRRLGWVWADTPLDRWARTCPRSTLSWWPRTTCSRKPWLQTKGQSHTPCYSIWGSFISVNMLTMK